MFVILTAPTAPPSNITAYNTSSTSLQITWQSVPEEFASGRIAAFELSFTKLEQSNSVFSIILCATEFQFSLENLTVFTNYCIQLAAFTRRGIGNMSECLFVSTDEGGSRYYDKNLLLSIVI